MVETPDTRALGLAARAPCDRDARAGHHGAAGGNWDAPGATCPGCVAGRPSRRTISLRLRATRAPWSMAPSTGTPWMRRPQRPGSSPTDPAPHTGRKGGASGRPVGALELPPAPWIRRVALPPAAQYTGTVSMIERSYRYIVRTPGVRGGNARIEGTRVAVHDVIGLLQTGETVDSLISRCSPDLTRAQVYECLAYYEDHRGEIDVLVARQMSPADS